MMVAMSRCSSTTSILKCLKKIHGITEETTTGVHRLLEMLKKRHLKSTGHQRQRLGDPSRKMTTNMVRRHSLNDAIKRATDHLLSGKKALVVGYGDGGGKGSAASLRQEGIKLPVASLS